MKNREFRELLETMEIYQLKEGIILTMNEEGFEEVNQRQIKTIPIWKWLLAENS